MNGDGAPIQLLVVVVDIQPAAVAPSPNGWTPAATGERETASRIPMWPRDDLHVRDRDVQFVGCRRWCFVGFWRSASSDQVQLYFSVPDACIIPVFSLHDAF